MWQATASGCRPAERCVGPRTGGSLVPAESLSRRRVSLRTAFLQSSRHTEACTVSRRLSAAADVGDSARRRHGDGDGVRSDNGGVGRSRRTSDRRVLVKLCRPTREPISQPLISTFYSDSVQTTSASALTL